MTLSQDLLARVVNDSRMTPNAVRLVLHVALKGTGEHEIPEQELQILLGCKGDKPIRAARDRAAHCGYLRYRRGGKGHCTRYEWAAPQGGPTLKPAPQGEPNEWPAPEGGPNEPDSPPLRGAQTDNPPPGETQSDSPPPGASQNAHGRGTTGGGDSSSDASAVAAESIHPSKHPSDGAGPSRLEGRALEQEISRLIRVANRGTLDGAGEDVRPINTSHGSSRQVVHDWLVVDGIPPPVIEAAVLDAARRWRPDKRYRRITSMAYFGGTVHEAHERWMAQHTEVDDAGRAGDGSGTQGKVRTEAPGDRGDDRYAHLYEGG